MKLFGTKSSGKKQSSKDAPVAPILIGIGDDAKRPARTLTLSELAAELFTLTYSLRRGTAPNDPADVRQKTITLLERFDSEARKAGYAADQVEAARFALVALVDETVLSSQWPGKDIWRSNPLQRELFKINTAGEEFFKKLEILRADRAANRRALELFYSCLGMGFEGRYKLLGREKLEGLIRELSQEIGAHRSSHAESMSPNWRRPDEFPESVGEGVPVWLTLAVFIPAVLLEVGLFALAAGLDAGRIGRSIRTVFDSLGR